MDDTLYDIAKHAEATCATIMTHNMTPEARLNLLHHTAGIFVSLQRSIYRAHDRLYKIESSLTAS